jgi:hypothetical protein
MVKKTLGKYVRTTIDDVRDASKKLNPHQEPRSKKAAAMRRLMDNAKKKKTTPDPHVDPKKRMGPAGGLKKLMKGRTPDKQAKPATKMKPMTRPKNN